MRLLFVARRFAPDVVSGTETVFARLREEALSAGHEVHLVAGFRRDAALLPPGAHPVDLRGHGASAWARMAFAAARVAREVRPDVVLSNSIEVRVPGVPTVTVVHDLNFGGSAGLGAWGRRQFYRAQSSGLARIVAVSEVTRQALVAAGVAPEKVVTVHNGVDLARFVPSPRPPDGSVRLVQVSRFLAGKGQHCAVDALARLRPDERKHVSLALVGTAADPDYVDRVRVQAWGLPVTLHLDVPDVVPFYQAADIALFPTRMPEGFGYGAIEAMACGLPVLGFADSAVTEATGGLADLVATDDVVSLRDRLRRLMSDPDERLRRGRAARVFVERYSWSTAWAAYERVLRAACETAG